MAGVEADPEVVAKEGFGFRGCHAECFGDARESPSGEVVLEKVEGLPSCFEEAVGFWLEAEMNAFSGLALDGGEVCHCIAEGFGHGANGFGRFNPGPEGTGHCADASVDSLWQPVLKDGGETVGVFEALAGLPVGCVDVFFHAGLVELAKGKSVNGERIHLVFGEKIETTCDFVHVLELGGGSGAETQTEAEPFRGLRHGAADAGGFVGNVAIVFRPGFTWVNILAVGEMNRWLVTDDHRLAGRLARCRSSSMAVSIPERSMVLTSKRAPMWFGKVTQSSPPRCSWNSRRPS